MHGRSSLLHCTCDLKATFTAKGNNPKDFWTGVELCYQTCTKRSIFRKHQGITNFNKQLELDWHNANAVKKIAKSGCKESGDTFTWTELVLYALVWVTV